MEENKKNILVNGDGGFNQTKIIEALIINILNEIMVFDDIDQTYNNIRIKIKELSKGLG